MCSEGDELEDYLVHLPLAAGLTSQASVLLIPVFLIEELSSVYSSAL